MVLIASISSLLGAFVGVALTIWLRLPDRTVDVLSFTIRWICCVLPIRLSQPTISCIVTEYRVAGTGTLASNKVSNYEAA